MDILIGSDRRIVTFCGDFLQSRFDVPVELSTMVIDQVERRHRDEVTFVVNVGELQQRFFRLFALRVVACDEQSFASGRTIGDSSFAAIGSNNRRAAAWASASRVAFGDKIASVRPRVPQ